MKKLLLTATSLIALFIPAIAQNAEVRAMPDTLIWKDNPAFPKGVQIATLVGDPTRLSSYASSFHRISKCLRILIPIPKLSQSSAVTSAVAMVKNSKRREIS